VAQVTLTAVGSAAAGPIGGMLGAVLGGYIDRNFLFKPNKTIPPNADLKLSAADEGAPLPIVFGTARVPCTCMWVSETRRREHGSSNGKGGQGANVPRYTYSADVAYAVCAGETEGIEELYANSKRIYNASGAEEYTGFAVEAGARTETWRRDSWSIGVNTTLVAWLGEFTLELKSPDLGPDLTVFVVGGVAEMTGWTAPYTANNTYATYRVQTDANNYDFQHDVLVDSVRRDDTTNETFVTLRVFYEWRRSNPGGGQLTPPTPLNGAIFAEFPDGTGGQPIRIFEATTQFSAKKMDGITFYLGTDDQLADPTIEGSEPDDVPAYRGRTYFVIRDLQITDYANVPPMSMEALVRRRTDHTLQEVIEEVCERAGLQPSEVDASACSSIIAKGSYALGPQSAQSVLENLLVAYDVVVQGLNGVQTFFPRADAEQVTVADEDLAAHMLDGDTERDYIVEDGNRASIAREITVQYRDPSKRMITGSQRVRRAASTGLRAEKVDLGVAMSAEEAHAVAGRLLWLSETSARQVTVQLPPTYMDSVRESTRLSLNIGDRPIVILLSQVDRGDNGLLLCTGVREDVRLLDQPAIASASLFVEEQVVQGRGFTPPPPAWGIFDNACLDDAHVEQPGFYWWASVAGDVNTPNTGFSLFESVDDGSTWSVVAYSAFSATDGSCTSALSDAAIPGFWDEASTLTVVLRNGAIGLESVTELQCLNGANRAIVGREVIGYRTATLTARNTYELTGFLRGLQGTEQEIDKHFVSDGFVSLSNPGVEFVELNSAALFQERLYKVVPDGGRLTDYPEVSAVPAGSSVRPLVPVHITVNRDASDNITITSTRRGRGVNRLFSPAPVNLHEARVVYYFDIADPVTPTIVVRRVSVVSADETVDASYTAAEQTADGYTPGDPITFEVKQLSAWLGTGQALTVTG